MTRMDMQERRQKRTVRLSLTMTSDPHCTQALHLLCTISSSLAEHNFGSAFLIRTIKTCLNSIRVVRQYLCGLRRFLSRHDIFGVRGLAELQHARVYVETTQFCCDGGWHKFIILQKK